MLVCGKLLHTARGRACAQALVLCLDYYIYTIAFRAGLEISNYVYTVYISLRMSVYVGSEMKYGCLYL